MGRTKRDNPAHVASADGDVRAFVRPNLYARRSRTDRQIAPSHFPYGYYCEIQFALFSLRPQTDAHSCGGRRAGPLRQAGAARSRAGLL